MKILQRFLLLFFILILGFCSSVPKKTSPEPEITKAVPEKNPNEPENAKDEYDENFVSEESETGETQAEVSDPLEGFNRPMFAFNDFFFSYLVNPLARGYAFITPRFFRKGIQNFIINFYTPGRLISNLLQAKFAGAGKELGRFTINTTIGVAGLWDASKDIWEIEKTDEDFDQVLGAWKIPPGPYIHWPFLGPSGVRATFGFAGDVAMRPQTYLFAIYVSKGNYLVSFGLTAAVYMVDTINDTSLDPDAYANLKKDALDPYVFFRDVYLQYRKRKVEE
jgi:phospholipid-binding lipoprotein MlaA